MSQRADHLIPAGTLVIADRFELRREGLVSFLKPWASSAGLEVQGIEASGGCPQLEGAPLLIVVNAGAMPLACPDFLDWVAEVRSAAPQAAIVVLAESDEPHDVLAVLDQGVRGYIPNSMPAAVVLQALSLILAGGEFFPPTALLHARSRDAAVRPNRPQTTQHSVQARLTSRQDDVLCLLKLGKPNKVIARELDMQESTVKVHVREIMRKLGVSNRTEAALLCRDTGADARPGCGADVPDTGHAQSMSLNRRTDLRLITRM